MSSVNQPAPNSQPNLNASSGGGGDLVSLQRSYYFSSNDRYDQEQYFMKPLTAPGNVEELLAEKVTILKLDKEKTLLYEQMQGKLRIDGVYCDKDPQIHQKCTDLNVLRLEQRILREKESMDAIYSTMMPNNKSNYFKRNGELKIHNDLLADEITRPADLAFESSEAYQTKEQNAILCDRMHSYKKRYYRLDLIVGKIYLHSYPDFFALEDRLAIELKEFYKEWERRSSLALIPFYLERVAFMETERQKRIDYGNGDDIQFLQDNINDTRRKLDIEKGELQYLAENVYKKWREIKELRKKNGFSSTNIKMNVHKGLNDELYFNIVHEEPSSKQFGGAALPSSEVTRRNNTQRVRAYVRVIINGHYVTRSRKVFLRWPNLELDILEQFEVYLFTMPSSIQLELVVGGLFTEQLVDVINVEVPGSHVKALTSAATLIKDIFFSKNEFEKRRNAKKNPQQPETTQEITTEEEKKRRQIKEQELRDSDVRGVIYVKTEWKGEGPEMPPMRQENVFKQGQAQKNRKHYDQQEQQKMLLRQLYIDVNDPRNEAIIRLLRETKNEFLIRLLKEDSKNPCSQIQPFRHMLLENRAKDPELAKMTIPLLEAEVIQDSKLLDKLEILMREKAYKEMLERKIEMEKRTKANKENAGGAGANNGANVFSLANETNAVTFDSECIRRRQMFFDKLKHFQRDMQSGNNAKSSTQYKSVVREFELLESENPLLALFNKMFITGRKLKPVVQKRQAVSLETTSKAKILVHVIKGFNVPIRNSAKQDILSHFQGGGGQRGGNQGMLNMTQNNMNPYNRTAGPYPATLSQLQNTGMMGGMIGAGDPRSTFLGGQGGNGGFGGMRGTMNDNRMMGVDLSATMGGYSRQQNNQGGGQVTDIRKLGDDQLTSIYRTQRVEPAIEVRIVYNEDYYEVKLTNISEGDFPEWNEILEFPLLALNKKRFTRQELINSKSMIYVTLFDREIVLMRGHRVEIETNFRYLGSFSIPLLAVLNNPPKIDAIFKVNRPMALFNYQVEPNTFFFLNQKAQQAGQQLQGDQQPSSGALTEKNTLPNTYISMSISLDPVLELPQENELEYYIGLEKQNLLYAAAEWVRAIKKGKLEKRNIKAYGENVNGQSVLLCRYITPQNPPHEIFFAPKDDRQVAVIQDLYAIEKAARFVSLIPMIEDSQAFSGAMPDLWCDSQEFLDLGAGDCEEHAILLCNYFNFIDEKQNRKHIKSYVCLGLGYPEGKTAYVMRRDTQTNHVELWNPMRGEAYFFGREENKDTILGCITVSQGHSMNKSLGDAICQLQQVGCVFNAENVWANIQESDDPGLIAYDIENTSNWKPFLTNSNRDKYFTANKPIPSIQLSYLKYMDPMPEDRADAISISISNYIKNMFERQRIIQNSMRTKWNNQMEETLKNILDMCETKRMKARQGAVNSTLRQSSTNEDDFQEAIKSIQHSINQNAKGLKSWGFPINVTFISLPMLWEEVRNTQIHLANDDDAEFSLYVHVQPYSHNVLSVWFYLLVLTKDRRRNMIEGGAQFPPQF